MFSGVFITADGDINLQAARIRGPNVIFDVGGSINFNNLMLSASEASSSTKSAPLGFLHETLTRSGAGSVGSNIQAIVLAPGSTEGTPAITSEVSNTPLTLTMTTVNPNAISI